MVALHSRFNNLITLASASATLKLLGYFGKVCWLVDGYNSISHASGNNSFVDKRNSKTMLSYIHEEKRGQTLIPARPVLPTLCTYSSGNGERS